MSQYAIVIEGDGSANCSAYAPDLAGVAATGDTLQECEAAMREAIEFHIERLRLAGESGTTGHKPRRSRHRWCLNTPTALGTRVLQRRVIVVDDWKMDAPGSG